MFVELKCKNCKRETIFTSKCNCDPVPVYCEKCGGRLQKMTSELESIYGKKSVYIFEKGKEV